MRGPRTRPPRNAQRRYPPDFLTSAIELSAASIPVSPLDLSAITDAIGFVVVTVEPGQCGVALDRCQRCGLFSQGTSASRSKRSARSWLCSPRVNSCMTPMRRIVMKSRVRLYASGPFDRQVLDAELERRIGSVRRHRHSRDANTAESCAASWRERSAATRCASESVSRSRPRRSRVAGTNRIRTDKAHKAGHRAQQGGTHKPPHGRLRRTTAGPAAAMQAEDLIRSTQCRVGVRRRLYAQQRWCNKQQGLLDSNYPTVS